MSQHRVWKSFAISAGLAIDQVFRSPNLSKVGATARNARSEADNFNSDRPERSRRGAVVTPEVRETPLQIDISKCAFASSADILQCVFNVRNVPMH